MDSVEYRPYEEWWQDEMPCKEFCIEMTHLIHNFDMNLSKFPNGKDMSRKEWMKTFLLWLEYEK